MCVIADRLEIRTNHEPGNIKLPRIARKLSHFSAYNLEKLRVTIMGMRLVNMYIDSEPIRLP